MSKSSLFLALLMLGASCSKVTKKGGESSSSSPILEYQRTKDAEENREKKFRLLMGRRSSPAQRFSAAEDYFKSFYFQIADEESYSNDNIRRSFYLDAATEFANNLSALHNELDFKKMSPMNDDKELGLSFYSLAATVHVINIYQEELAKKLGRTPISIYGILKKALLKDSKKEPLLQHEEVLVSGANRKIMVDLLRARVDMLASMALKDLTEDKEKSLTQKSKDLIRRLSGGRFFEIELPEIYPSLNETTKSKIALCLQAALETKTFLKDINVDKDLEKNLKNGLKSIDFNEKNEQPNEKNEVDEKKDKLRYLILRLLEYESKDGASYYFLDQP